MQGALPCEAMKRKKLLRFFSAVITICEDIAQNAREAEFKIQAFQNAAKEEKRRARFPWPDVKKMTFGQRRALAQVFYKHGYSDAATALAPPGATLGYSPDPNPGVRQAVQAAINAFRGRPAAPPSGYWCALHGNACPDRQPAPPAPPEQIVVSYAKLKSVDPGLLDRVLTIPHIDKDDTMTFSVSVLTHPEIGGCGPAELDTLRLCSERPAPPVERIMVSIKKLHAIAPNLLDRIQTIPHKDHGPFTLIFSIPTLIDHGCGPAELATLRLCSVGGAAPPAEPPAVDPDQGQPILRLVELEQGEVGGDALGLLGGVADRCGRATTKRPATLLRPGLRSTSKGIDMDEKTLARFEAKIQRSDGCHEWLAAKDQDGYGIFQLNRRARRAHHIAYALAKGISPDGLYLLHSCDNPSCVNPDHLTQGDTRGNTADRHAKGRDARGERNGHPKLNEAAVRDCFRRYREGESQRSIARAHGISQTLIRMVLMRKVWKHIDV